MAVEQFSIAVQGDFVAAQTRAKPIAALAELIWNGLDADATSIDVELVRDDLAGGLSRIVVYDNGEGFSRDEARKLFGSLGGSWKRTMRRTKRDGRMIHGQEGRGRYKAFALGGHVVWKVCFATRDGNRAFDITMADAKLTNVTISEDVPAPDRATGVIVQIDNVRKDFRAFETADGHQELAEIFALYMINYRSVSIRIAGDKLDPEKAIASESKVALPPITLPGESPKAAELHIIEWRADTKRTLYLCSEDGFPLD